MWTKTCSATSCCALVGCSMHALDALGARVHRSRRCMRIPTSDCADHASRGLQEVLSELRQLLLARAQLLSHPGELLVLLSKPKLDLLQRRLVRFRRGPRLVVLPGQVALQLCHLFLRPGQVFFQLADRAGGGEVLLPTGVELVFGLVQRLEHRPQLAVNLCAKRHGLELEVSFSEILDQDDVRLLFKPVSTPLKAHLVFIGDTNQMPDPLDHDTGALPWAMNLPTVSVDVPFGYGVVQKDSTRTNRPTCG
mmetsp:Transcript_17594/g.35511  ORF Transcript_17594/g.35511 Transcript_17594/m.35511 type:complete len:251 (+) Transcript_17594:54-806(+)